MIFFVLASSMIFGEVNNSNVTNAFGRNFSYTSTFIFYFIILSSFIATIYIAYINKIIKLNKRIIIFIFIGIITITYMGLVVFLTDYSHLFINNSNKITNLDKIKSLMDVSLSVFMAFILMHEVPRFKEKDLAIRIFCYMFIIFSLVMIIYSLNTEFHKYVTIIKHPTFFTKYEYGIQNGLQCLSFFKYGNVYGHVLFLLSLVILLLSISYNCRYIFLFNIIVGIFIIFSGSRSSFLGFVILLISYGINYLIYLYRKNKVIFYIIIILLIFLFFLITIDAFYFKNITIKEAIIKSDESKEIIHYSILDLAKKCFNYMKSRLTIFDNARNNFILTDYIFGIGYNINDLYCRTFDTSFFNYHNGYIEVFTSGGIYLCVLYLFLLGYIIYNNFKINKNKSTYKNYLLIILAPYLVYQLSEAFPFLFNVFGGGIMAILLIMVPFNQVIDEDKISNIRNLFIKVR